MTGGPYRLVRNPIYTGMLGMLLATGLAWSRPLALVLGTLVFCAGTVIRIRAEERLLRTAFGETWQPGPARTPAPSPALVDPRRAGHLEASEVRRLTTVPRSRPG